MTGFVSPQEGLPKLGKIVVSGVTLTDDSDAGVVNYVLQAVGKEFGGERIDELIISLPRAVSSVLSVSTLLIGDDVDFYRGVSTSTEEHRFEGEVVNVKNRGPAGWILFCRSRMWRAAKHIFSNDYLSSDEFGGSPGLIWKNHMTRAGVPVDDAYIQADPVGVTINRFPVDDARAYERATQIVDSVRYRHYYDSRVGSARFEPIKFADSGITLSVGDNVINRPEWDNLGDELIQQITIRGAASEPVTTETPSEAVNGSNTVFSLSEVPASIKVLIDGSEKRLGINGVTDEDDYDYYVDPLAKRIIFNTAPTGSTMVVEFSYLVENPVVQKSPVSIAQYATDGAGEEYPYMDVFHLPEITDLTDATTIAASILREGDSVVNGTTLRVRNVHGLRPNLKVRAIDVEASVDESTYVSAVEYHYPYDYDSVVIDRLPSIDGDVLYNAQVRIKRLEEQLSSGKKVLLIVRGSARKVGVGRRFFKKESRQVAAGINGFILDHGVYGVLDTSELDATGVGDAYDAWVLDWQVPGGDTIMEYFSDAEYIDTGSSDATLTTSTRTASFTSGQFLQTEVLVKGKTYSTIKVVLGTVTGSLQIDVSEDSAFSSPQTITADTTTALTIDTSNGLYVRFTEDNTSTASLTPLITAYGVLSAPAFKIVLS